MRHLPSKALLEKELKKRVVDRYWAGVLAGGASWIFREDVDAARCVADGKESCEFVVGGRVE